MVRILSQQEMSVISRNAKICYLCGAKLSGKISQEHIIPKSYIKFAFRDSIPENIWYPQLPVHSKCDELLKRDGDECILSIARLHSSREPQISQDLANVRPFVEENFSRGIPLMSGVDQAFVTVFRWVQGFHFLLYGSPLSDIAAYRIVPPVPHFMRDDDMPVGDLVREGEELAAAVGILARSMAKLDMWDGVHAKNNIIRYRCIWIDIKTKVKNSMPYTCVWWLDYSGLADWTSTVHGWQRPWCGMYQYYARPSQCSFVANTELRKIIRNQEQELY